MSEIRFYVVFAAGVFLITYMLMAIAMQIIDTLTKRRWPE